MCKQSCLLVVLLVHDDNERQITKPLHVLHLNMAHACLTQHVVLSLKVMLCLVCCR